MQINKFIRGVVLTGIVFGYAHTNFAQSDPLQQGRMYVETKNYDKANEIFKKLYDQNPADVAVYNEYFNLLLATKDFKAAERLINEQQNFRPNHPMLSIDMGRMYLADGKEKKAQEQFDKALDRLNGDDIVTQQMANTFSNIGRDDYALKTYEKARDLLRNPFLYSGPLSRLYAKTGAIDKAVNTLMDAGPGQLGGLEETKATLLEFIGTDSKKIQQAQKTLIKKINEQPENPYYAELLTWLYTQKNDWEGAMMQIAALDERNKEQGERVLEFARMAARENKYDYALKGFDAIIAKGKELPYYAIARAEKLNVLFAQLRDNYAYKPDDVTKLEKEYESFLADYPGYYASQTARDYATLEAQYANNPQKAVDILQKVIDQPGARKDMVGLAKLQLGDYYVLQGKVWDASLTYSQVDKAFKEDVLGEEARFRNAKLAYYRGDFEWAQGQLSVLKASTSELIANDALYLSVLITENITADSNMVPLRRFAYADLLLFQNKDKEAEDLLDSLNRVFPKHALRDDILMQKARISIKHRDYEKALTYLGDIHQNHKTDVLGDDALFKTAEIYDIYLKKPKDAVKYYEQLIIDYPGSTYIQTARNRIAAINASAPVVP